MSHRSAFAAAALAAVLAPGIAMAQQQDAKKQADPFAEGALISPVVVSACTTDSFTEVGKVVVALSASDVKKLGNGDLDAGIKKIDVAAVQSELAKAWKAFAAEMTSADLTGTEPSEKVQKSLEQHFKEFTEAETKATGVHFAVAQVTLAPPAPGCAK